MSEVIQSLLDVDFYKFSMGQFVWKNFPEVDVRYAFKNRTKGIDLSHLKAPIKDVLSEVKKKHFSYLELMFLKNQSVFCDAYLEFLSKIKLPDVYVDTNSNNELQIETSGKWSEAIYWETIILSAVNELYYNNSAEYSEKNSWKIGEENLLKKIEILKKYPELKFSDFGTRRRFSSAWHRRVLEIVLNEIPNQFLGTSNVHFAKEFKIKAIGTHAHELFCAGSRILGDSDEQIRTSQNIIFDMWYDMYGEPLSIALTDTFGTEHTFKTFGKERAKKWKGMRQDSGDPAEFARKQISTYQKFGIDPKKKIFAPSDGLTVEKMVELHKEFFGQIIMSPGWGTSLTNDVGLKPLSMVMKVVEANGKGTVKLSDNIAKAMGSEKDVERFKNIFGYTNTKSETTIY